MHFEPKEFQTLGIDWLKDREESALFAGMGLGKTAMTLSALNELFIEGVIRGALIIAPKRVSILTWPYEIKKWDQFKWMKVALLRTPEGVQAWKDGSADIYLLNYERIPQFCKQCLHGRRKTQMPVQAVIWDEISKAKDPSSKRINTFRHYRDRFTHHWGLTGTPRPNGYLDLFAPTRLLDNGKSLGQSHTAFRDAFFDVVNPYSDYPKFAPKPGIKDKINRKMADIALTLRSEDHLKVPTVHREDIEIKLTKNAQSTYLALQKEFLAILEDRDLEITAPTAAAKLQKLLQVTSGAVYDEDRNVGQVHSQKIKALKKLFKNQDGPLLVATQFIHEKTRILEAIPQAREFTDDCLSMWEAGRIDMLVADPRSIGHGVDRLQNGGKTVVWFTPTWSFELYNQFNSRLVRMGQDQETTIYHLLCPDTVDDAVMGALQTKEEGESAFLLAVKNIQTLARAA